MTCKTTHHTGCECHERRWGNDLVDEKARADAAEKERDSLLKEKESWGNEFSAVCMAKYERDALKVQLQSLISDLETIKANALFSDVVRVVSTRALAEAKEKP